MAFWFNLDTKSVETDDTRGPDANVLGPYPTYAEASAALAKVEKNNDTWDDEDREWDAKGASPAWDDEDLED